jgi:hypothetical protein
MGSTDARAALRPRAAACDESYIFRLRRIPVKLRAATAASIERRKTTLEETPP